MRKRRKKKTIKKNYIQLEVGQIPEFRKAIHIEQNMICPICESYTEHKDTTLDHQHKLNQSEPLGKNGAGCLRGTLCRLCNTFEGRIWNNFTRLGFHKRVPKGANPIEYRVKLLRNLADYLESGTYNYIHPSEKPKLSKMGKMIFNRINKAYKLKYPNRKPLEIPKSAIIRKGAKKGQVGMWKITKRWEDLINELNIKV